MAIQSLPESSRAVSFSPVGHFIVLRGVTDDGQFLVNDPAGKYSVNREFTWDEIERTENFYMIFGE